MSDRLPGNEWTDRAACKGVDLAVMFPGNGRSFTAARKICAGCPVVAECGTDALLSGVKYGMFGGMSPDERSAMRGKLGIRVQKPRPPCGTTAGHRRHRYEGTEICELCRCADRASR
jgi:WhiB family redox-sensing transcriptional regulator